jgi:hypothetical protein
MKPRESASKQSTDLKPALTFSRMCESRKEKLFQGGQTLRFLSSQKEQNSTTKAVIYFSGSGKFTF